MMDDLLNVSGNKSAGTLPAIDDAAAARLDWRIAEG